MATNYEKRMIEQLATIYNWIQKKLGGELIPPHEYYVDGVSIPETDQVEKPIEGENPQVLAQNVSLPSTGSTELQIGEEKGMVDYTDVLDCLAKDVNNIKAQIIEHNKQTSILNNSLAEVNALIANVQSLNPPQIVSDASPPPVSE